MMIKITEKCSMGCSHCMNNALPTGKHMDFSTFKDAIEFFKREGGHFLLLSGGEPGEHPEFKRFLTYACEELPRAFLIVATNGTWMCDKNNNEFIYKIYDKYKKRVMFQVTTVDEYYPKKIDTSLPVFKIPNVVVCREIENMYGQGRALTNHLDYHNKCSRCTNLRLVAHQIHPQSLKDIIDALEANLFYCTPFIDIRGDIKLGESDLCPTCSNIYKETKGVVKDIIDFDCHQCDHINKHLAPIYRNILKKG